MAQPLVLVLLMAALLAAVSAGPDVADAAVSASSNPLINVGSVKPIQTDHKAHWRIAATVAPARPVLISFDVKSPSHLSLSPNQVSQEQKWRNCKA